MRTAYTEYAFFQKHSAIRALSIRHTTLFMFLHLTAQRGKMLCVKRRDALFQKKIMQDRSIFHRNPCHKMPP